jgi:hypothetical protein
MFGYTDIIINVFDLNRYFFSCVLGVMAGISFEEGLQNM